MDAESWAKDFMRGTSAASWQLDYYDYGRMASLVVEDGLGRHRGISWYSFVFNHYMRGNIKSSVVSFLRGDDISHAEDWTPPNPHNRIRYYKHNKKRIILTPDDDIEDDW